MLASHQTAFISPIKNLLSAQKAKRGLLKEALLLTGRVKKLTSRILNDLLPRPFSLHFDAHCECLDLFGALKGSENDSREIVKFVVEKFATLPTTYRTPHRPVVSLGLRVRLFNEGISKPVFP